MAVAITFAGLVANGSSFTVGADSGIYDTTRAEIIIDCYLTLSGNYGSSTSHGDPILFDSVTPPIGALLYDNPPSDWTFKELVVAGALAPGFTYNYCPGPTLAAPTQNGGVLQILGAGASAGGGGQEITEGGAYSSLSLNGTVVKARFTFARQ